MPDAKLLTMDAESTGIDTHEARIIQWFMSTNDTYGNPIEEWEWFINPGIEVPEESTAIHGFTNEFIQEHGVDPREALEEILTIMRGNEDLVWVAYNLNYDLSLIRTEFERHGIFGFEDLLSEVRLFDPLVVDRAEDKYRKGSRKLEAVAAHYGIEFDPEKAHNASYDVEITARVASKVGYKYGVPTKKEQAEMYYNWATGYEEYCHRKGDTDKVIEKDWPLRANPKPKEGT